MKTANSHIQKFCHPGESRDPRFSLHESQPLENNLAEKWVPAFAGMTDCFRMVG
jgi:hypothetical protein